MNKLLLLALSMLFLVTTGLAEEIPLNADSYLIEAEEMSFKDNASYTAKGRVRIKFRDSVLYADNAEYNPLEEQVLAEGNVILMDDIQVFRANRVRYDMKTESGIIENMTGLLNGKYYICARELNRKDKDNYELYGARVTTCSGLIPDWSFSFGHADAEINGYIVGEHATGNIKEFPYFYAPKLLFPLKVDRQTGFLIPKGGYATEKGVYIGEQFFWAIGIDKDATVGAFFFSERGTLASAEFRYAVTPYSNIYLSGEVIEDSYSPVEDSLRMRYTSKSNLQLPLGLEVVADADYALDYMYMRDFYSYSIYDYHIKNEENAFIQNYMLRGSNKYLRYYVSYTDNLKYNDTATGYLKTNVVSAPRLFLQNNAKSVGGLFYLNISSQYDFVRYIEKEHNFSASKNNNITDINYTRFHNDLSLYRTFNLPILKLTPTARFYYTQWNGFQGISVQDTKQSELLWLKQRGNNSAERLLPHLSVKANLNEIYRLYEGGKHGILNSFTYDYINKLNQTGLPEHLSYDKISPGNDFTWFFRSYYNPTDWITNITLSQTVRFDTEDNRSLLPLEANIYLAKQDVFNNTLEFRYSHYRDQSLGQQRAGDQVDYMQDTLHINFNQLTYMEGRYTYNKELKENNTEASFNAGITLESVALLSGVTWHGQNRFMEFKHIIPSLYTARIIWISECFNLGGTFEIERYRQVNTHTKIAEAQKDYRLGLVLSLKGLGESNQWLYSKSMKDH